jgi:cytochrome P450
MLFDGPRVSLYSAEFAADPHLAYREMRRRFGTMVPVDIYPGVPATLVLGYRTAVRILNDPEHFSADPRTWQKSVPSDLPILPMVEWRPNALRSDGREHTRYRAATNAALAGVDLHGLHTVVERAAVPIINSFCAHGHADLISQYILPLVFTVLNDILGCPAHIGARVAAASAAMFEGVDTVEVNAMFQAALLELTQFKRAEPGDDVATRLVHHSAGLSDEEMIHQLVICYATGIEPPQNLIANTLLLMLTDARFTGKNIGFAPPTGSALDEILSTDPPVANHCVTYPRQPILIDGVWLPADQPVITSMAACNNDPKMNNGQFAGNGWHLGWGAGPHACPKHAQSAAYQIARDAIDQLLDALPELRLAVPTRELVWRPGPFHRALTALPITFPPSRPLPLG